MSVSVAAETRAALDAGLDFFQDGHGSYVELPSGLGDGLPELTEALGQLLFGEKSLKTVCFFALIFKKALQQTRNVCLAPVLWPEGPRPEAEGFPALLGLGFLRLADGNRVLVRAAQLLPGGLDARTLRLGETLSFAGFAITR